MQIINGDCRDAMREMDANSISSIVTDPPYGLKFMGKGWDHSVPGVEFWQEALRVAKPGCHLLAFGGTRTFHRLMVAIEDAGWEIRDCLSWVYGSGFPKSHDISKAIDKEAGAERKKRWKSVTKNSSVGTLEPRPWLDKAREDGGILVDGEEPVTDAAKQWQGYGTALKPSFEPIILARKPLTGTVAGNVLEWGTGGLNIDGSRVELDDDAKSKLGKAKQRTNKPAGTLHHNYDSNESRITLSKEIDTFKENGRWPANFIHDGSEEVTDLLGNAARFFYCAKASPSERGELNNHPTVKPLALMRYLIKLVTPPSGIVLDLSLIHI